MKPENYYKKLKTKNNYNQKFTDRYEDGDGRVGVKEREREKEREKRERDPSPTVVTSGVLLRLHRLLGVRVGGTRPGAQNPGNLLESEEANPACLVSGSRQSRRDSDPQGPTLDRIPAMKIMKTLLPDMR